MLSRSHGQQKIKTPSDHTPAGKVFQVEGSDLYIYIPSWCLCEIDGLQLIFKTHSSQGTYCHKRIADAFFAYHSTSTIPTKKICDHLNIAAEQSKDDLLSVIIQALQTRDLGRECLMNPDDHRTPIYKKLIDKFFLELGTSVLMVRDSTHSPRLVVPYKLHSRFLYQAHDCINHSGIIRMKELLSSYWWEFKNRDIETYVNSCSTCARCKGNYGKRVRWPIGHCKRGKRPFDLVFINFVTMPNSEGKRYILTILDSFSRHFTAIPCTRDRAIDTARGMYQFFLRHREIPRIVSSDRSTHFTGEVYRQFCNQISIT